MRSWELKLGGIQPSNSVALYVQMGTTAIGIRTKEGVVLAVEKRLTSPLLEPGSIEKIMEIDRHIGAAMSGITADAQTLIDHARVEATNHWFSYNEKIRVQALTQAVCDLALSFGEGSDENNHKQKMVRPFAIAIYWRTCRADEPPVSLSCRADRSVSHCWWLVWMIRVRSFTSRTRPARTSRSRPRPSARARKAP